MSNIEPWSAITSEPWYPVPDDEPYPDYSINESFEDGETDDDE